MRPPVILNIIVAYIAHSNPKLFGLPNDNDDIPANLQKTHKTVATSQLSVINFISLLQKKMDFLVIEENNLGTSITSLLYNDIVEILNRYNFSSYPLIYPNNSTFTVIAKKSRRVLKEWANFDPFSVYHLWTAIKYRFLPGMVDVIKTKKEKFFSRNLPSKTMVKLGLIDKIEADSLINLFIKTETDNNFQKIMRTNNRIREMLTLTQAIKLMGEKAINNIVIIYGASHDFKETAKCLPVKSSDLQINLIERYFPANLTLSVDFDKDLTTKIAKLTRQLSDVNCSENPLKKDLKIWLDHINGKMPISEYKSHAEKHYHPKLNCKALLDAANNLIENEGEIKSSLDKIIGVLDNVPQKFCTNLLYYSTLSFICKTAQAKLTGKIDKNNIKLLQNIIHTITHTYKTGIFSLATIPVASVSSYCTGSSFSNCLQATDLLTTITQLALQALFLPPTPTIGLNLTLNILSSLLGTFLGNKIGNYTAKTVTAPKRSDKLPMQPNLTSSMFYRKKDSENSNEKPPNYYLDEEDEDAPSSTFFFGLLRFNITPF